MEQLHNGFTLEICEGGFPLSTDSIALSGFVKLPKNAAVLDLGSGCGSLGLLLCASYQDCSVTGIELDEAAHQTALKNICANAIESRLNSICADLNDLHTLVKPGSFHCCVSNPPYFTSGPQSKSLPTARREDTCSTDALFAAAAWALKYGGDFFLVHRPERLGELCAQGSKYKLEAKRLCLLRHRTDGPVSLILLQFRKGGNPGLSWEEESLFDAQGAPTPYYRKLYHFK
ncbi:MAG: methyltransferase [Oscillospiraceae bacterium]|nr:methyltransferase [Oscillospiraceae bacterium]